MRNSQLVHSFVNCLRRLVEGFFKIGHVVRVAMMMGDVIMFVVGSSLAHVIKGSVDQR